MKRSADYLKYLPLILAALSQSLLADDTCSSPIPGQTCSSPSSSDSASSSGSGFGAFMQGLGAVLEGAAQGYAASHPASGNSGSRYSPPPAQTYTPPPQTYTPPPQSSVGQACYTDTQGQYRCFQTLAEMRQYQVQENANSPKFVGVDTAARYREQQAAQQQAQAQQQEAQRQQQQRQLAQQQAAQRQAERVDFTHSYRLGMDMGRQVYIVTINNTGNVKLACKTTVWGLEYGNFGGNQTSRDFTDSQNSFVWPGMSATGGQWNLGGVSRYTVNCSKSI